MPIIQSVDRALHILDLFDEYHKELKLTEITERMNLHKSTVHSLLKTLQKHHYIEQNKENGKYTLGMKLFERGNYVIQSLDLRTIAREHLMDLSKRTGRTVHLVILDGKEGIYIDKVESSNATILYSRIGRRVPIHSSGVGKALVAFKEPAELEKILEAYEYTKQTRYTLTDKDSLLEELKKVREQGYATDNEENEPGVFCVGLPIRDHSGQVVAAISSSTTAGHITEESLKNMVDDLKITANKLSENLGFGFQTTVNE
ncbi:IclR family transcriptional regulator [Planococcus sp. CPCC 101016]|uniref:IclR family transcriptional regulator n=1 Tax=Planococcus sp. CPCC 101016 TaxID=2599617 RepID=UPI0011B4929B|nr:IclR family transcriptional regulator [Planococcus sp. CPCC 101016]TWT06476.1 IclR family transcriptional regulator [Planococcus sp. CPCC 101016]